MLSQESVTRVAVGLHTANELHALPFFFPWGAAKHSCLDSNQGCQIQGLEC